MINWDNFCLKGIVNDFIFEINAFSDKISTLHKHRLSKPSFDALLNKSKENKFGCLKMTLEKNNALSIFLEIILGQEPQMSPGKDPTGKLGQNF